MARGRSARPAATGHRSSRSEQAVEAASGEQIAARRYGTRRRERPMRSHATLRRRRALQVEDSQTAIDVDHGEDVSPGEEFAMTDCGVMRVVEQSLNGIDVHDGYPAISVRRGEQVPIRRESCAHDAGPIALHGPGS